MLINLYYIDNKTGSGIDYKGNINPGDKKADLRTRTWYTQAIATYSPIITGVYADIDTGKPVLTVSYALKKITCLDKLATKAYWAKTYMDTLLKYQT